jgi:dTDP-4-amino-4,6-dideoxygalactose transaminase
MATVTIRATEQLAMDGGSPVRTKPWLFWPDNTEAEWKETVEPALREVYLSRIEGLPGPKSAAFGQAFADYCGATYGLFMPHGTDAIAAALSGALDLDGFGDSGEVLLPNYTFVASASAPLDVRCSLAFVDVDPVTYTMSVEAAEAAIRPGKTVALLPVHLGGHPANMDALNALARKHGLKVVEDCAQSHGAEVNGRKVGSLGDAGAFSFQSSKNLTSGEGGAVTTDDMDTYHRVHAFSNVGRVPGGARWEYPRLGWNYRTSEYLAVLLLTRLPRLEEQTQRRFDNAAYLSSRLSEIEGIQPPVVAPWATMHGYHLYIMRYDPAGFGGRSRGDFLKALSAEGVDCTSGYGQLLSEEGGMKRICEMHPKLIRVEPCPNIEAATQECVWLYQNMFLGDRSDMDDIIEAIAKIQRAFRG